MNYLSLITFLLLFLFSCENATEPTVQVTDNQENPTVTYDGTLTLPNNFKAVLVAENTGRARHLTVNNNGDIYIQLGRKNEGHGLVALRDTNKNGQADRIERFGDTEGTEVDIYNNFLYCSSDEAIYRYPLEGIDLVPDDDKRVLIAGGFPSQGSHASKTFTFDNTGNLYVNVGAPSNACMENARTKGSPGLDPCPQLERQAGVWKFSANKIAQTQTKDATRYASGIRNSIALDWNDATNSLYVVQHGRDQLSQFFPDLFTEKENAQLPSEEFFQIDEGDFLGWPYCYYNHESGQKLLSPEYGGNRQTTGRCAEVKKPILGFPGHLAPNDLLFYNGQQFPKKYHHGAFVAFHGSWNRAPEPQEGYFIAFVPMDVQGNVTGDWEIFADGFAGENPITSSPRNVKHRPCGIALGPDGSLFVVDSQKGHVWKIVYVG